MELPPHNIKSILYYKEAREKESRKRERAKERQRVREKTTTTTRLHACMLFHQVKEDGDYTMHYR